MKFNAWEHFLALWFAQVTFCESLRDIEACLRAQPRLDCHLGFRSRVARSTSADANERRDWRLFVELAHWSMPRELDAPVYALGSSLIDLSIALCPWSNWTGTDAAVKLHTLLKWPIDGYSLIGVTVATVTPERTRYRPRGSVPSRGHSGRRISAYPNNPACPATMVAHARWSIAS